MAVLRTTLALAAVLAVAQCQITSPINGAPVTVAQTGLPQQSSSSQPSNPSVTGPDQTFTGHFYGETPTAVGVDNGKPVVQDGVVNGVQQNLPTNGGTLQLSGNGISAGDQTAGVSGNAFGHGETTYAGGQVTQNHFEPHGANYGVTANGQQYSGTVGANPDGLGGEGPVIQATGRKLLK